MFETLRAFARSLKSEIAILASALKDPRTPWLARVLGAAVVAYAVSPIDLIPDFIPVVGFLDELILLPAALWLIRRLIPATVLADHRARVAAGTRLPPSRSAALVIITVWILALALTAHFVWPYWQPPAP